MSSLLKSLFQIVLTKEPPATEGKSSSFPKRRPELQFLKQFSFPTELPELRGLETWQRVLGQTPQSMARELITAGLLQEGNAEVVTLLQSKSKEELKSLAKIRNISQSGTKEVLARRLFEHDPNGMRELYHGKTYLMCTPKGKLLVDGFLESEEELGCKAERAAESALRAGRYEEACAEVAEFEAGKVFQRGLGIDWSKYDASRDLEVLSEIASIKLTRHNDIPQDTLDSLRISAGMMNLWGTSKPEKWLAASEKRFANEAHALWAAAIEAVNLRAFKRIGIKRVEILSSGRDNMCLVCRNDDKKIYEIEAAPKLPHEGCTCEIRCGCTLIAVQ